MLHECRRLISIISPAFLLLASAALSKASAQSARQRLSACAAFLRHTHWLRRFINWLRTRISPMPCDIRCAGDDKRIIYYGLVLMIRLAYAARSAHFHAARDDNRANKYNDDIFAKERLWWWLYWPWLFTLDTPDFRYMNYIAIDISDAPRHHAVCSPIKALYVNLPSSA